MNDAINCRNWYEWICRLTKTEQSTLQRHCLLWSESRWTFEWDQVGIESCYRMINFVLSRRRPSNQIWTIFGKWPKRRSQYQIHSKQWSIRVKWLTGVVLISLETQFAQLATHCQLTRPAKFVFLTHLTENLTRRSPPSHSVWLLGCWCYSTDDLLPSLCLSVYCVVYCG